MSDFPRSRSYISISKNLTWGSGFVHDLFLVILPPPQETSTNSPCVFGRKQGVATVDQGDQPPWMVMVRWDRETPISKAKKSSQKILSLAMLAFVSRSKCTKPGNQSFAWASRLANLYVLFIAPPKKTKYIVLSSPSWVSTTIVMVDNSIHFRP